MEGEDAMSSYDPHGRGVYKGFDLKSVEGVRAVEVDLGGDKDGPVAFKKRKTGGGGKPVRRRRTASEDD